MNVEPHRLSVPQIVNISTVYYIVLNDQNFNVDHAAVFKKIQGKKIAVVAAQNDDFRSLALALDEFIIDNLADCDQIIIYHTELNKTVADWAIRHDLPGITFLIPGKIDYNFKQLKQRYNNYWLMDTSIPYRYHVPEPMAVKTKPYMFEIMYGARRPGRQYVADAIAGNIAVRNKIYQAPFLSTGTGMGPHNTCTMSSNIVKRNEFWEDDIIIDPQESGLVQCKGHKMFPSQVVPFKIYGKAWHSMICETHNNNDFVFTTEKIAKPMIAGRIFVVFTSRHYLKLLRQLGFQTFNNIIDESYDDIEDKHERWDRALQEVYKLTQRDPLTVINQCQHTLIHNAQHLKTMNLNYAVDLRVTELTQ